MYCESIEKFLFQTVSCTFILLGCNYFATTVSFEVIFPSRKINSSLNYSYLCHLKSLPLCVLIFAVYLDNWAQKYCHVLSMIHLSVALFHLCQMEVNLTVRPLGNSYNSYKNTTILSKSLRIKVRKTVILLLELHLVLINSK